MDRDEREINNEDDAEAKTRRRRFVRAEGKGCALTPKKQALLLHLSQCRLLSLPQLAALEDLTEKAARKHLRAMFDSGFVQIIAVPRSVLVDTDTPNDPSLLYGSAPNIYQPTKEGLRLLWELGKIEREERERVAVPYGPKNATFLAHEVQVRDIRVWLERCRRWHQGALRQWEDNGDATFDLASLSLPQREESGGACRDRSWNRAWCDALAGEAGAVQSADRAGAAAIFRDNRVHTLAGFSGSAQRGASRVADALHRRRGQGQLTGSAVLDHDAGGAGGHQERVYSPDLAAGWLEHSPAHGQRGDAANRGSGFWIGKKEPTIEKRSPRPGMARAGIRGWLHANE
jgi:hypothetical protein